MICRWLIKIKLMKYGHVRNKIGNNWDITYITGILTPTKPNLD